MVHTDSLVAVVDAQIALLKDNAGLLGLQAVYYGDQNLINTVPCVTVEGADKSRDLQTTSERTRNVLRTLMMVYYSRMQPLEETQRDVEVLAEQVEALLHEDRTLGGLVIHGFVSSIEPGYARRDRVLLRVARIVWQGTTLTRLGG